MITYIFFFFFKQKTAYEIYQCDWSSDVCSSDLDMLYLKGLVLQDLDLSNKHFESTEFLDCVFENCSFTHSFIVSCTLKNCEFRNCTFTWSKFLESDLINTKFNNCIVAELELCDIVINGSCFSDCREILDLKIRGNWKRNLDRKSVV